MQIKHILSILVCLVNFSVFAAGSDAKTASGSEVNPGSDEVTVQKVVDEYKAFVASVKPEMRSEIITYRKEVAKLNKQKRDLYQKLSHGAQDYLAKEQDYKKKLPRGKKTLINIQQPGEDLKSTDKAKS